MVVLKKYVIEKHCHPGIASAITQMQHGKALDPTKKRERSILKGLADLIDTAITSYRLQLVSNGYARSAKKGLSFSRYFCRFGRHRLDGRLLKIHRLLRDGADGTSFVRNFPNDFILDRARFDRFIPRTRQVPDVVIHQALDTIETLRYFLDDVKEVRRPRSKTLGEITTQKRNWNTLCKFCGELTEMEIYAQRAVWRKPPRSSLDNSERRYQLSSILCHKHRSKSDVGDSRNAYRLLLRREPEFKREFRALVLARTRSRSKNLSSEDRLICAFLLRIVDSQDLYRDNESGLADAARALVDCGISDRKKLVIMLACCGRNQAAIAGELKITKQAVSKILRSIPDQYRFDLAQ